MTIFNAIHTLCTLFTCRNVNIILQTDVDAISLSHFLWLEISYNYFDLVISIYLLSTRHRGESARQKHGARGKREKTGHLLLCH